MADELPLFCVRCDKHLKPVWDDVPDHPSEAFVFRGDAPYGSRFDCEAARKNFDGFEIYVCDDCWVQVKSRVLGYQKPTPSKYYKAYES